MASAAMACGQFIGDNDPLRKLNCQNSGFTNVDNGNKHANADISATTLFDGPQKDPSKPIKRFSVNYSKDNQGNASPEDRALSAFMRNIGVQIELRGLLPGELSSNSGHRFMAIKDSFDARMSFALRPLMRHKGMSSQSDKNIPSIKAMAVDNNTIKEYLDNNVVDINGKPNWESKGVSADELINVDVMRKYENLEWNKSVVKMSDEEIAREQLRVSAQESVLLWRLNQEAREYSMLLGGLVASTIRKEALPELKAAHNEATR